MIKQLKSQLFDTTFGQILLVPLFLLSVLLQAQYDIPNRPTSDESLIFNYAQQPVLTPSEEQALNQKLIQYEGRTSTQIALVILDSLQGEDENFLGAKWLAEWQIGQKDKDNGMVILMSVGDRRISIQNGYGLEPYMTDAMSWEIINNIITPHFKDEKYYEGLDSGLDAIFNVLDGKFVEENDNASYQDNGWDISTLLLIAFLFFVLIIILKNNNRGGRGGNGGRRSRDIIFTDFGKSSWPGSSGGFGGGFGGGGSFGGGGFGGFGGGMGGGGGASGGW